MSFRRLVLFLLFASALILSIASPVGADDIRDAIPTIATIIPESNPVSTGTDAVLTVRTYNHDYDYDLPHLHRQHEIVSVDVTNYLAVCADGSSQVRAIAIGSWQFDLDGECAGDEMTVDINVVWNRMLFDRTASPSLRFP